MSIDRKETFAYLTEAGWSVKPAKGEFYEKVSVLVTQSVYPGPWRVRQSESIWRTDDTNKLQKLYEKYGKISSAHLNWD